MIGVHLLLAIAGLASSVPAYRNTAPIVQYVGTRTCATCHANIAARYSMTAMGRSMSLGDDISSFSQPPLPFTVFDNEAGEYFEVSRSEGALFQTQYAFDRDGKQIFRQKWKIAYVIGSGENGVGFLIQRDGYLFEAPLSYYSKSRAWSFSPGYERHNYAFTRPVVAECAGCHSGRAQPVYSTAALYQSPPFTELPVGCENCHGPGELHVAERRASRPLTGSVDTSIVNPAHLSGWLSDNICMKCHQGGDVRVPQPGKHDQDFRPGTPLDNVVAIFKAPLNRATASSQTMLLEHYFSMTLSKCYRASARNLRCTSCHDPHVEPDGAQAPAYYRARCLSCHESRPCKLVSDERQSTTPPDDCVVCHMPKRTVPTITHAALTEHRVTIRVGEPFPEEAFRSDESDIGLIHLSARQDNAAVSTDITLFQAYATLVHAGHEEFRSRMNNVLDRLSLTSPNNPVVLSAMARRAAGQGTREALEVAMNYATRAIKAGSTEREDFLLLAELYDRAHKNAEGIEILRLGMRANPYLPQFPEAIAAQYVQLDDYRNALDVIRRGLQLFPDDLTLRALGDKVRSAIPDEATGNHSR